MQFEFSDFNVGFVIKTKDLLERYEQIIEEGDRDVTFFLNCLLGLIVNISETSTRTASFKKQIHQLGMASMLPISIKWFKIPQKKDYIITQTGDEMKIEYKVKEKDVNQIHTASLKDLLTKIRNSIAHQHIEAINSSGKWIGVKMWNFNEGIIDFKIEFTIVELKNFTYSVVKLYLDDIKINNPSLFPTRDFDNNSYSYTNLTKPTTQNQVKAYLDEIDNLKDEILKLKTELNKLENKPPSSS